MTELKRTTMDTTNVFDNRELEEAPLDRLVESAGSTLVKSGLLAGAAQSGLYRRRWREARFDPEKVTGLGGLRQAPFTTESDLASACCGKGIRSYACSDVQMWFRAVGKSGGTWWMPFGKNDVMRAWAMSARLGRVVGMDESDIVLMLSQPAPAAGDSLPYFLAYGHNQRQGAKLEVMPVSLMLLQHRPKWTAFFLRRRPTVMISTPADALLLARIMKESQGSGAAPGCAAASNVPDGAPRQAEEPKSRGPLEKLRMALLYGPVDPAARQAVSQEYAAETFHVHGTDDCLLLDAECRAHEGVHIWLDACIPEILPAADPADSRAKSRAIFLHEAKPGTRGELVVTTFAEALPLIRYRTGETVEVVSAERCGCGLSHPRVRFV